MNTNYTNYTIYPRPTIMSTKWPQINSDWGTWKLGFDWSLTLLPQSIWPSRWPSRSVQPAQTYGKFHSYPSWADPSLHVDPWKRIRIVQASGIYSRYRFHWTQLDPCLFNYLFIVWYLHSINVFLAQTGTRSCTDESNSIINGHVYTNLNNLNITA